MKSMTCIDDYVPFEPVSDDDLAKARLFNSCRLSESGCWLWVGSRHRQGYGRIRIEGKLYGAHVRSYKLFKGEIPKGLYVLHSCDTPSCCNPMHLRVGTQKENMAECVSKGRFRKSHGTLNNLAKLTDADILDIRNSALSPKALSEKYDIDRTNVHQIVSGKTWQHVPMPETRVEKADGRAKLNPSDVAAIRSADASISLGDLAGQYEVSVSTISMIRNGRIWKRVTASGVNVNGD
jgi:HNH endonuclease